MGISVADACRQDFAWPDDPRFWRLVRQSLPSLRKIKFTGGEPFLSRHLAQCLEEARDLGRRDLQVQVTTNVTRIDARAVALLRDLDAEVVVSLDGTGLANDFIRYPSRWEQIVANIRWLREAGIPLRINATCSLFNTLCLPALIDFNHETLESRLTIMPVLKPEIFDPSIAPQRLKDLVKERLERWAAATAAPLAGYYCGQILQRQEAAPPNPRLFERFRQYVRTLCAHRNLEIGRYLPDLARVLAEEPLFDIGSLR